MNLKTRQTCRLCGSRSLVPVFDLGNQYLATQFISNSNQDKIPLRRVPLELVRCNPETDENACGSVQLRHSFPPPLMYSEYWYRSGVNQTMRDALNDIILAASKNVTLQDSDIVVDIGCNDGTLLNSYENVVGEIKLNKFGFDPAQNLRNAETDTFTRIPTFFNKNSFRANCQDRKAKIVTSIAMFYGLEDPNAFVKDVSEILDESGIWILQMADLPNMLKANMFDNICHEHLFYYHLAPLEILFKNHGLKLVDLEMNNINGSSYRLMIRKQQGPEPTYDAANRIYRQRMIEFNLGLDTDEPYRVFKSQIEHNRKTLISILRELKESGRSTFVYGASTKGNVLLQYCGIEEGLIPFAADRNPKKWGTKTLGSNIPIISEEDARNKNPDYFLILPYHFLDEVLKRESEFLARGGKFIVPVPEIRII